MVRPCLTRVGSRRRDATHRAFRHVAGDRSETIEMLFADSIGERVDETGDVRLRFLGKRRDRLFRRKRLGERGGKAHDLDAEARIDGFKLVADEPGQARHVAHRPRRADADGLDTVVDAMKEKIETPRAKAFGLEGLTELGNELARGAGNCFSRANRLREDAADFDEAWQANRVDRLAESAKG